MRHKRRKDPDLAALKRVRAMAQQDPDWQWRHVAGAHVERPDAASTHRQRLANGWHKLHEAERKARR